MLLFHTHVLEIKTCLASARARLAAKSRAGGTWGWGPPPQPPCVPPSHPSPAPALGWWGDARGGERGSGFGVPRPPGATRASPALRLCTSLQLQGRESAALPEDPSRLGSGREVLIPAPDSSAAFIQAQKLGCSLFSPFLASQ